MAATMRYPSSRIGVTTTTQCERCKRGEMQDSRLRLPDADGDVLEILKWTCNACGYTMLFDLDVALSQRFKAPDYDEVFPDWVEQLLRERRAR
jgi:predicted nucleic-acid-binding Zn-ribbon protein